MTDSMEVLGWTLVHFCWQATAIALLYRVTDLLFAKSRSHIRYGLALAALMSMLLAAVATLGYEGARAAQRQRDNVATVQPKLPAVAALVVNAGGFALPVQGPRFDLSAYLVRAMPWLDALWLAGVVILSVRTAGGWCLIRRLRRGILMEVPDEVSAMFSALVQRIGIGRQIDLYISQRISGPLTMGVLRSVVLLPVSAVTHLSPSQLEVVLAHELAHIRRGDYLWNMIQTAVETLFFFHPAVWWVSSHLREQRELCCDDVVLACCSDPVVYATALLSLEEQRGAKLRLAMALDGHQRGLKARILRILGERPERHRQIAPLSVIGVCAMLGLFLAPLPRLFADRAPDAHAEPLQVAAVVAPEPGRIGDYQSPAPAPNPIALRSQASAQAPATPSGVVPAPHPAPRVVMAPVAPAAPMPAPMVTPVVAPLMVRAHLRAPAQVSPNMPTAVALEMFAMQGADPASAKNDYITEMRAAGYGSDLDKLIAMKIQGITPEYARSMATLGFGKPTDEELIELKIFGVTPETVQGMKAAGIVPSKLQDLVSYQIFKVTPEFVAGMKDAGFSSIPPSKLVELRVHGVTPESAKATRQQFPDVTLDQLIQLHIFHIDAAFIASAKSHGFEHLTVDKLVRLRISGLLDDSDQKAEKK